MKASLKDIFVKCPPKMLSFLNIKPYDNAIIKDIKQYIFSQITYYFIIFQHKAFETKLN